VVKVFVARQRLQKEKAGILRMPAQILWLNYVW